MNRTIVALVEDKPGVLNRIASMFRRRGFNIASLAVGHSEKIGYSRMTFVVEGDEFTIDQVTKQLNSLIDVITVSELEDNKIVARELAIIKVATTKGNRAEIMQLVEIFRANIVDVSSNSIIVEVTGEEDKIESLCSLLKPFGIKEIMRTGRVAMLRGLHEKS